MPLGVPAGDDAGGPADEVDGLVQQIRHKLIGIGFRGKATRQAEQCLTAAVDEGYALGGNQTGFDLVDVEGLGEIIVGPGLHARDAVV